MSQTTTDRNTRTPTNVRVKVLDLSGACAEAYEHAKANDPKLPANCTGFHTLWELGYVMTRDGDVYYLNRDGVGGTSPISDKNRMVIQFYPDIPGQISPFPVMAATVNKEQLLNLPVKSDETLDEFIRRFGARLEENYETWREKLEPLV